MAKLHQSRQKPHPRWHKEIRLALELVPLVAVEARPVVKDASRNAGARVGKFGSLYLVEQLLQQDADIVELVEWNRRRLLILHGALSAPRRHTCAALWSLNDYPKEDADDSVVEQVWTELAHKLSGVCDVVWTQPLVVGADCSSDGLARRAARQVNRERSQVHRSR